MQKCKKKSHVEELDEMRASNRKARNTSSIRLSSMPSLEKTETVSSTVKVKTSGGHLLHFWRRRDPLPAGVVVLTALVGERPLHVQHQLGSPVDLPGGATLPSGGGRRCAMQLRHRQQLGEWGSV